MSSRVVTCRRSVAPEVDQLGTYAPIPGVGHLGINAFLVRAREPVLVDSGIVHMQDATLAALATLIDLADLRYLYLTHADSDHIGCVDAIVARAPHVRIVTTFLGMTKLVLAHPIPPERILIVNPGEDLDAGDRKLRVVAAPCFDAPETTLLWDPTAGTLFSSDYFGSLLPTPAALASEIPEAALRASIGLFLAIDVPWARALSPAAIERATAAVLELRPDTVLGGHLPPAYEMIEALTDHVRRAPDAPAFVPPDQAAFARMLGAARR